MCPCRSLLGGGGPAAPGVSAQAHTGVGSPRLHAGCLGSLFTSAGTWGPLGTPTADSCGPSSPLLLDTGGVTTGAARSGHLPFCPFPRHPGPDGGGQSADSNSVSQTPSPQPGSAARQGLLPSVRKRAEPWGSRVTLSPSRNPGDPPGPWLRGSGKESSCKGRVASTHPQGSNPVALVPPAQSQAAPGCPVPSRGKVPPLGGPRMQPQRDSLTGGGGRRWSPAKQPPPAGCACAPGPRSARGLAPTRAPPAPALRPCKSPGGSCAGGRRRDFPASITLLRRRLLLQPQSSVGRGDHPATPSFRRVIPSVRALDPP